MAHADVPYLTSMVHTDDPPHSLVRTDVSADATNYSTSQFPICGDQLDLSKYIFLFLTGQTKQNERLDALQKGQEVIFAKLENAE